MEMSLTLAISDWFMSSTRSVCFCLRRCSAGDDAGAVDLSSMDLLKESFHMAGSYNWSNVDLTQFPGGCSFLRTKLTAMQENFQVSGLKLLGLHFKIAGRTLKNLQ